MKKILFILSGIFLSYLLVGAYLSHTEYSYREWVDFCGISIIGLALKRAIIKGSYPCL